VNEIWAIVLGAALATVGGIIGALVNNYINKTNEKEKEKKEAYTKILDFCNQVRLNYNIAFKNLKINELSFLFTLHDLYLSKKTKNLFDSFIRKLTELDNKEANGECVDYSVAETIQEQLIIQIKKELKL